ncbi:hypothetical protein HYT84_04965, partial [Candidatus Micrarchaeota archaeon]|nr:hypothetical protein [Candidatus Micrarchaeota archaeon]
TFDGELVYGGSVLGGKYGALNYLSCDYANKTDVGASPGGSFCEAEHLWEVIYVPKDMTNQECTISSELNKKGVLAYTQVISNDADGITGALSPTYCVGDALLANGQTTSATYSLNEKYENGDLKLNKAILKYDYDTSDGISLYTAFYTTDPIWLENGEIKSGYEDRKGKFYDSNIYRAFFLNDLPGFDLVFTSKGGEVKIYKLKE